MTGMLIHLVVMLVAGGAAGGWNHVVRTSCTSGTIQQWNHRDIEEHLAVWWNSLTSVYGDTGPHLLQYNRVTGRYSMYSTASVAHKEEKHPLTVSSGLAGGPVPTGLSWQMSGGLHRDGYIYGVPNNEGVFTGDELLFVYPDFRTGIKGMFENGVLVRGREVKITGERCNLGVKELKYKIKNLDQEWFLDLSNRTHLSSNPTILDPHERKSVYVRDSIIPGSEEGLFAKRNFIPGDLVSYFNGIKTVEEEFLFSNLTGEDYWTAHSYYFNLAEYAPEKWDLEDGLVVDIPPRHRSLVEYRATLAHKTNHKFSGTNVEFDVVLHPMYGPIACIVATKPILRGEELFVNYYYELDSAPPWYVAAYKQHKLEKRQQKRTVLQQSNPDAG